MQNSAKCGMKTKTYLHYISVTEFSFGLSQTLTYDKELAKMLSSDEKAWSERRHVASCHLIHYTVLQRSAEWQTFSQT